MMKAKLSYEELERKVKELEKEASERKRVEKALLDSEERFRSTAEMLPSVIVEYGLDGILTYVNPHGFRLAGYEPEDLEEGFRILRLVAPEEHEKHYERIERMMRGEKLSPVEYRLLRKGGSTFWGLVTSCLIYRDGEVVGIRTYTIDISEQKKAEEALQKAHDKLEEKVKQRTAELLISNEKLKEEIEERKRAERALRQSEERYRTFINSTSDIAFLKDEHFRHIMVNKAYSQYLGIKEKEIIGKTDFELLPTMLAEGCRQSDLNALKTNGVVVSEEWDGDRFYETRKFPVNFGEGKCGIGGYVREITEQKQAEEALKSERDKLKALIDGLDSASIGVDIVSIDFEILQQNQTLIDRFGDSVGKKCYKKYMALEEPCSSCPMAKALENKRLERTELHGDDGRDYEILSAPLTNPDGTADKAIEIILDITDRKRAEKERLQKEKLQGIVELAGAVCHELNQPLQAISGISDLSMMDIDDDSPIYENIQAIKKQVYKMADITRKLMAVTQYKTKDYLKTKIIDIDKASEQAKKK